MMTDIYFSFPDQATQQALLPGPTSGDAGVQGVFQNMDIVGFCMAQNSTPQNVVVDTSHWLVNVRLLDSESVSEAQQAYIISAPEFAKRVWF